MRNKLGMGNMRTVRLRPVRLGQGKLVHSCYLNKSSNPNPDPNPKPNPNPNLDSAVIGRTY